MTEERNLNRKYLVEEYRARINRVIDHIEKNVPTGNPITAVRLAEETGVELQDVREIARGGRSELEGAGVTVRMNPRVGGALGNPTFVKK